MKIVPVQQFKFDINLGGGFKYFLFSPLLGKMIQFDEYFSDGWFNHQLVTSFKKKVAT